MKFLIYCCLMLKLTYFTIQDIEIVLQSNIVVLTLVLNFSILYYQKYLELQLLYLLAHVEEKSNALK